MAICKRIFWIKDDHKEVMVFYKKEVNTTYFEFVYRNNIAMEEIRRVLVIEDEFVDKDTLRTM